MEAKHFLVFISLHSNPFYGDNFWLFSCFHLFDYCLLIWIDGISKHSCFLLMFLLVITKLIFLCFRFWGGRGYSIELLLIIHSSYSSSFSFAPTKSSVVNSWTFLFQVISNFPCSFLASLSGLLDFSTLKLQR